MFLLRRIREQRDKTQTHEQRWANGKDERVKKGILIQKLMQI